MALHGRAKFFGQMFGGIFYMGTNDQIMQGGNLMVKRFQRTNQVSFSSHWLWPGYWYIIWNINTTNRHMGTIFRIWSVLAQIQPSSDPRVKQVSNTVINIGLVIMSLDSGLTVGGNFFVFFIIFVILIRLGRAYRLGWVIFKLSHGYQGMRLFLWGKLTPQDTM